MQPNIQSPAIGEITNRPALPLIHDLAVDQRVANAAAHLEAGERGVLALALQR